MTVLDDHPPLTMAWLLCACYILLPHCWFSALSSWDAPEIKYLAATVLPSIKPSHVAGGNPSNQYQSKMHQHAYMHQPKSSTCPWWNPWLVSLLSILSNVTMQHMHRAQRTKSTDLKSSPDHHIKQKVWHQYWRRSVTEEWWECYDYIRLSMCFRISEH